MDWLVQVEQGSLGLGALIVLLSFALYIKRTGDFTAVIFFWQKRLELTRQEFVCEPDWSWSHDFGCRCATCLPHLIYRGLRMSDSNTTPSFEAKLAELEALVRQMEQGSMPLDTSLEAFEKGVKLAKECHAILDTASQKVTEIKQSGEESPFDPEA